ncbi:MAG: 50S ribosomal protein L24e [Nanoarchaeota archaeon]|nr:50S ribosomal protein L24e [Nanoarchaeota archaeon]
MTKCVFCGKDEADFKGVYLIKNDGSINYYCSSKCRKGHLGLKRDRRKVRWTEAFHVSREKRRAKEKEAAEKAGKERAEKAKKLS